MDYSIYKELSERTGGDIYIGVVGPVRTGKSTFIKKFMETLVLPAIQNENVTLRAVDELPQSAAGRDGRSFQLIGSSGRSPRADTALPAVPPPALSCCWGRTAAARPLRRSPACSAG